MYFILFRDSVALSLHEVPPCNSAAVTARIPFTCPHLPRSVPLLQRNSLSLFGKAERKLRNIWEKYNVYADPCKWTILDTGPLFWLFIILSICNIEMHFCYADTVNPP